jgi:hypothetical protein
MVPFTSQLSVKQYIKGGITIFVLCGKSGEAYDFIAYQDKTTEFNQENLSKFGEDSTIVLQTPIIGTNFCPMRHLLIIPLLTLQQHLLHWN